MSRATRKAGAASQEGGATRPCIERSAHVPVDAFDRDGFVLDLAKLTREKALRDGTSVEHIGWQLLLLALEDTYTAECTLTALAIIAAEDERAGVGPLRAIELRRAVSQWESA